MKKAIATIFILALVMGIGNALECTFDAEIPVTGDQISDTTPVMRITPVCDGGDFNITFNITGEGAFKKAGVNNTVNTITWTNTTLAYGTQYTWYAIAENSLQGNQSSSSAYTFTVTRFGDSGATIQAIADGLATPIVNLVLKVIPLFVAIAIVGMIKDLLSGVGDSVETKAGDLV